MALLLLWAGSACTASDPVQATGTENTRAETVVLLHGLGRSKQAMWLMDRRIGKAGFNVVRVGYDSLTARPQDIVASISNDIEACCRALDHPVHFVGHSLGGLLIRAYLAEHRPTRLGRVVLIGTPNSGTSLVDQHRDSWWFQLAGPTAEALGTDPDSFPNSLPEPDYPVGIIAALDDRLVPIESTKLPGMADFATVESSHSMMRYNDQVAQQTIAYLRAGHFNHAPGPIQDPEQSPEPLPN